MPILCCSNRHTVLNVEFAKYEAYKLTGLHAYMHEKNPLKIKLINVVSFALLAPQTKPDQTQPNPDIVMHALSSNASCDYPIHTAKSSKFTKNATHT